MPQAILVMTTCAAVDAARLADGMVGAGLAACVNQIPGVTSTYHWQGELHHDAETLLLIKTQRARWPELERWITAEHRYEVPELIVLDITTGLPAYLQWLAEQADGSTR